MEFDYPEHLNDSNLLIETFFFFKLTMTITMTVAKTIILFLVKKKFFIS